MVTKAANTPVIPDPQVPKTSIYLDENDFGLQVQEYIDSLIAAKLIVEPGVPAPEAGLDINDFFTLVQEALIARQDNDGVASTHRLLFCEEDPPEDLDTEAITFKLVKRLPGGIGQGAPGESRTRERTSHHRTELDHPNRPGETLEVMGRRYDNYIDFYIYAKTNKQARTRLVWFDKFMDAFRWYYRLFGFNTLFLETEERETIKIKTQELKRYATRYFVSLDETYFVSKQKLRELKIPTMIRHS